MAYATAEQLRAYLPQISASSTDEALITDVLARASAIIDTYVGWSFADATTEARVIYGSGTAYLSLAPYVAGSVTAVAADGSPLDAALWRESARSVLRRDGGTWDPHTPYTVTATYGYSAVPADIVEACLEIAARLWQARSAGFSDVIGVQDGAGPVAFQKALPALVHVILERHRRRSGGWLGVS